MDVILDTNVVIRYLVRDNESQYQQALQWFKQAEQGQLHIHIKSLIIAESVFVLESFYKQSKATVASAVRILISQPWLDVDDRSEMLDAFKLYQNNVHFVDSFIISLAQSQNLDIITFDKKLLHQFKRN